MPSWNDEFTGKIWTVQQSEQPDGRVFEKAVRAPGSRILIVRDGKILLSQEKRSELGGKTDNRLPGGKVFDKREEYKIFLESGDDIVPYSRSSIAEEAVEEVGIIVDQDKLEYLGVDILGATCSWDLHYWVSRDFTEHEDGAQFHETESDEIEGYVWVTYDDARQMALDKEQFAESRSALVVLRFLESEQSN